MFSGVEQGKFEMQMAPGQTYKCQYTSFSRRFPNSLTPVRVFASVNHGNNSSQVHDTVLIWVEDISTSRFKTCVVTAGQGTGANCTIDWFAFQGAQSGVQHGQARYGLFTTGTKCSRVVFSQVLQRTFESTLVAPVYNRKWVRRCYQTRLLQAWLVIQLSVQGISGNF